jgi:hypothetical protein
METFDQQVREFNQLLYRTPARPLSIAEFENFLGILVRSWRQLLKLPLDFETADSLRPVHDFGRLSIAITEIFCEKTKAVRALTETENHLLSQLDKVIGDACLVAAERVHTLKQADATIEAKIKQHQAMFQNLV